MLLQPLGNIQVSLQSQETCEVQEPKFSVSELNQHSKSLSAAKCDQPREHLSFPGMQQKHIFYFSLQLGEHEECHWFHHVFTCQTRILNTSLNTTRVYQAVSQTPMALIAQSERG